MFSVFSKYVIDETGGSYMDAVVEILKGLDYSPLYVVKDGNCCNDILILSWPVCRKEE